ncbi:MAG TPA: CHAP domain-containing protein [Marmoricola sp.]|nr:CHAP domain-containing protein [Marmoricola sp.]
MLPTRSRRRAPGLSLATLLATLGTLAATFLVLPVAPASADTRVLCKGFAQCSSMGYGNANYSRYYTQMWWRMYSGHNCTNYASYRMVRAGLPNTRPWEGSGNASNWGIALASKTDQTPMVRSIAWWKDRNHVQVVERVISRDRIIVSEDHWGGDFDWAEVRRGDGSNWPDGFIHLRDARVQNRSLPSVVGSPQVGVPLTASTGTWTPSARVEVQWLRNGRAIAHAADATSTTFTPRPGDVGAQLSVRVVAHRYGYLDAVRTSARAAAVVPGSLEVTQQPTMSGFPKVTATLTAQLPQFAPTPSASSIQWSADGQAIAGATTPTLALGPDLLGKRISFTVTATRPGYDTRTVTSALTEPVGPEKIEAVTRPRIYGSPLLGETLRLDPGRVNVADPAVKVQWRRNGVAFAHSSLYYSPTVDDLGDRISATVTYSKPGYDPVSWNPTTPHVVRSNPRFAFGSPASRQVAVRVVAEGVSPVTGYVTLTDGTHAATRQLGTNGRTVFTSRWITSGKHRFTVVYQGSRLVRAGQRTAWLTVDR